MFAENNFDLGRTGVVKHHINTGNSRPIKQHPRRIPPHLTEEADKTIDDMLARDVIKLSNSPWSSPIVMVKKKDGSCRFFVNYRRFNSCTVSRHRGLMTRQMTPCAKLLFRRTHLFIRSRLRQRPLSGSTDARQSL